MSEEALIISSVLWALSLGVWLRYGVSQLSSPTFLYLIFHLLSFVVRPWFIYQNEELTFMNRHMGIWPSSEDLEFAVFVANLGLVGWMIGALFAAQHAMRKPPAVSGATINQGVLLVGGGALILAGLWSYWTYAPKQWLGDEQERIMVTGEGGVTTAISGTSAYLTSLYWVIVPVVAIMICSWGLKWYFVPFLTVWFTLLLTLGQHRTTYLLGGFTLALAVMARSNRRWPSKGVASLLVLAVLFFEAGKHWMNTLITSGPSAAWDEIAASIARNEEGQGALLINFDFLVGATSLIPDYAPFAGLQLLGRPLYFWIPRAVWPDKPIFDYAAAFIGSNVPGVNFTGFTVTLVGESYMAFGVLSAFTFMLFYGFVFNAAHAWAYRHPVASVQRVFGIALSATMIQVFRDGLPSLTFFMTFYFGPCLLLWIFSKMLVKESVPLPNAFSGSPTVARTWRAESR